MEPILAPRLKAEPFNLDTIHIGYFFCILPVFYITSSIGAAFIPKRIENRVTVITCAVLTGIAYLFAGPSQLLGFPVTLQMMGIGMALIGLFNPPLIVGGMPEMVDVILKKYPK